MTPRRLLSLVLTIGLAAGLTLALLIRGTPAPAAAALGGRALPPAQKVPIPPRGPVTLAARADDPDGLQPWAVRRFTTSQRRQTYPCVQLGRLDAGRFGWIAPDAPFRLGRFDQADIPTSCGERFPRGLPQLTVTTLTTNGRVGLPQPARTIVWGVLPPGTTGARLDDGTTLRVGRDRVALAVMAGRPVDSVKLAGTLTLSTGRSRRFDYPALQASQAVVQRRGPDGRVTQAPLPQAPSDDVRVAARVPDPAGGAAWGLLTAKDKGGTTCFSSPSRLVGDRPAYVDPRLGLATPPAPFDRYDCKGRLTPSAARPVRVDVALFSIGDEDPVGTAQLRRLTDRTVLHGRAAADVRSVTISSSRDMRTVVPDGRAHAFLAVYDGTFPGERFKVTAHLRDGHDVTILQPSGA